jgi:hypothetical protein
MPFLAGLQRSGWIGEGDQLSAFSSPMWATAIRWGLDKRLPREDDFGDLRLRHA